MKIYNKYIIRCFIVIVCGLILDACSIKRIAYKKPPPLNLSEDYLTKIDSTQLKVKPPVTEWWKEFNDPILDSLIQKATNNNLDVKMAIANLYEARALFKSSRYDRFPTVESNAGYSYSKPGENAFGIVVAPYEQYNASFDASWELDFFGRVKQSIKKARAEEGSALSNLRNLHTSILAEVAKTYMESKGLSYRIQIAKENLKNQHESYLLTEERWKAGTGNELDKNQALTEYEVTNSTVPVLEAQWIASNNKLDVLTGDIPGTFKIAEDSKDFMRMPSIPATLFVGNAADLIRRRPDIQQAERQLAAATAAYNISVADLFPRVSILGSIGFAAVNPASFGTSASSAFAIGPSINWAAFNLGRVKANIRRQDAGASKAFANYEKTVLVALEEIQSALIRYNREQQQRESLRRAAASSLKAVNLAKIRYRSGLDNFLDVLIVERRKLEVEDRLALSEINTILNLIMIYKTLGGGWEILSQEQVQENYDIMTSKTHRKNEKEKPEQQ